MYSSPDWENPEIGSLTGAAARSFIRVIHIVISVFWIGGVLFLLFGFLSIILPSLWLGSKRPRRNTVPYSVPFLKNTIPFLRDGSQFLLTARQKFPYGATLQIPIFQDSIYLIQGPRNVAELFHDARTTVSRAYALMLHHGFGMGHAAAKAYANDTSGARLKPIPGSSAGRPEDRIILITHENLVSGLLKDGLEPITQRFQKYFAETLQSLDIHTRDREWIEGPDLVFFFEQHLGASLIRTLFGDHLLSQNPDFLPSLWEYDKRIELLASRVPRFLAPRVYRLRDKLLQWVKNWHADAVAHTKSHRHDAENHSYSDPSWGTKMMRERYQGLFRATGQDKDSVASADLAVIWASVTNVVPSSATLILQILRSERLLPTLRESLFLVSQNHKSDQNGAGFQTFESKDLDSIPLLSSLYAETLRFGVRIHIPRTAPHHDLHIGSGSTNIAPVPKGTLMVANTWLAHTDEAVWDNKQGQRPLDEFWAERFLVSRSEPSNFTSSKKVTAGNEQATSADSSQAKQGIVTLTGPTKLKANTGEDAGSVAGQGISFSTEALEGAWIPFGGGQHACPGRLLAKRVMLITAATMITNFDIEILHADSDRGKDLEFDCPRFGLGVAKPNGAVRFRIRRRKLGQQNMYEMR
ncbi:Cytochrome P450 [Rhypophila sp. PSN 637]